MGFFLGFTQIFGFLGLGFQICVFSKIVHKPKPHISSQKMRPHPTTSLFKFQNLAVQTKSQNDQKSTKKSTEKIYRKNVPKKNNRKSIFKLPQKHLHMFLR